MSGITVKREWAKHTGGTKFYQTLTVTQNSGGKSFVLFHWGSLGSGTKWQNPSWGGQTQGWAKPDTVVALNVVWGQKDKKKKRGYDPWRTEPLLEFCSDERAQFDTWIKNSIPIKYHAELTPIADSALVSAKPAASRASMFPATVKRVELETPTNPEWGTW